LHSSVAQIPFGGCRMLVHMMYPPRTCPAELALEVWVDCQPQGYTMDEARVPILLPMVAAHLTSRATPERARDLQDLFIPGPNNQPSVFQQLLRAQGGRVHFLHFWKSVSEVARMLDLGSDGGIAAELETLRDRVVRQLEEKGYMKSRVGYADPFCENVPVSMLLD